MPEIEDKSIQIAGMGIVGVTACSILFCVTTVFVTMAETSTMIDQTRIEEQAKTSRASTWMTMMPWNRDMADTLDKDDNDAN